MSYARRQASKNCSSLLIFQAFDLPQGLAEFEFPRLDPGAYSERPLEPPAVISRHNDGCSNHARYDWYFGCGNALSVRHPVMFTGLHDLSRPKDGEIQTIPARFRHGLHLSP